MAQSTDYHRKQNPNCSQQFARQVSEGHMCDPTDESHPVLDCQRPVSLAGAVKINPYINQIIFNAKQRQKCFLKYADNWRITPVPCDHAKFYTIFVTLYDVPVKYTVFLDELDFCWWKPNCVFCRHYARIKP